MGRDKVTALQIAQRDCRELAPTATSWRRFEIACIWAYPISFAWLAFRARGAFGSPPLWVLALLTGFLAADFISGIFHWFFDTWFTPDTPFIGRAFVRTFREHHIDPTAICRHDFVETNGSNIFAGVILVTSGHLVAPTAALTREAASSSASLFAATSFLFASVFMSITSQVHKWAHAERVPSFVTWAQHARLILPKRLHALHHVAPFDRAYCITSGWLNATLHYTRFFRVLERVISATTGALPRCDDIGAEAAIVVATEGDAELEAQRTGGAT